MGYICPKNMKQILLLTTLFMLGCNNNPKLYEADTCSVGMFTKSQNKPQVTYTNDTLIISSGAETDFFNAPNGVDKSSNAPILMKETDNTKPFTFTARVKPEFLETYDAGALYIFHNNELWQKFAFEMDERKLIRLVTVRTIGTSDDNNHDVITEKEIYMKISSDTQMIGFYYSIDGCTWQLVRLYRNEYPHTIYVGLSSQSPMGSGINTQFTEIEFSNKGIIDFRLGI